MIVIPKLGPLDNNAYLLTINKQAILIDAPPEGEKILEILKKEKLDLKYILITHGHPDHIASVPLLKEYTSAEVLAHEADMPLFLKPWNLVVLKAKPFTPDILLKDQQEIKLGNKNFISLKVIHTPGHSQGSSCFYQEKEKAIFSGDTLFYQALGRTDFPGGNYQQLLKSLKEKLFPLPQETKVFPGHGHPTNIGREKKNFK